MPHCAQCRYAALCLPLGRERFVGGLDHCLCGRVWWRYEIWQPEGAVWSQYYYIPALPLCIDQDKEELWPLNECRECRKEKREAKRAREGATP